MGAADRAGEAILCSMAQRKNALIGFFDGEEDSNSSPSSPYPAKKPKIFRFKAEKLFESFYSGTCIFVVGCVMI